MLTKSSGKVPIFEIKIIKSFPVVLDEVSLCGTFNNA